MGNADRPRNAQIEQGIAERNPRPLHGGGTHDRFRLARQLPDEPDEKECPGNAQQRRDPIEPARLRRIEVARRHEGEDRQHDDDAQRGPGAQRQHVEIKGHDVPERGEAQEIAVVGLGLHLAETVGAGQERQEEPRFLPGRQDSGPPDQEQGKERVVEEVDEIIEPPAVEARERPP